MSDPNIGQATAATYEDSYPDKPTNNIFNSMATFYALGEKGFKRTAPGGRIFEWPLEYAENTNFQMVGEFSVLNTTAIPVFDAARYDIKTAAGAVSYSYQQMLTNTGSPNAKFELIASLIENGRNSHRNLINNQLWNTATLGADDITSIPTIIASSPTTGTVGGINAATFTWWRNRQNSGAKTSVIFDNLISSMETTFNQCSLGGVEMTPTSAISDLTTFSGYESTIATRLRYFVEDLGKDGDAAFLASAIRFKQIPYFYDEAHPAARVDFLNNDVLKFQYVEGAWMKLDEKVTPNNQLVNTHKMYTMGNLTCGGRRYLGCVTSTTS